MPAAIIDWPTVLATIRPLYEAWGAAVAAEIHNLDRGQLSRAAIRYGVVYRGPKLARYALDVSERVALARAWLADGGRGGIPGSAQVNRPSGHDPGVVIRPPRLNPDAAEVTPPTARITRAPDMVDSRWAPDPDYLRLFSCTRPGIDPSTKEAWK